MAAEPLFPETTRFVHGELAPFPGNVFDEASIHQMVCAAGWVAIHEARDSGGPLPLTEPHKDALLYYVGLMSIDRALNYLVGLSPDENTDDGQIDKGSGIEGLVLRTIDIRMQTMVDEGSLKGTIKTKHVRELYDIGTDPKGKPRVLFFDPATGIDYKVVPILDKDLLPIEKWPQENRELFAGFIWTIATSKRQPPTKPSSRPSVLVETGKHL